jgi:hypothetical protein
MVLTWLKGDKAVVEAKANKVPVVIGQPLPVTLPSLPNNGECHSQRVQASAHLWR